MLLNEVNEIRDCTDLRKRCDIVGQVLAKCNDISCLPPEIKLESIQILAECVSFPTDEYGEIQSGDSDVKLYCRNAYLLCCLVSKIISQGHEAIKANAKSILPLLLTSCAPLLNSINPWSGQDDNRISEEILQWIAQSCGFESAKIAINQEIWLFEDTFEKIRHDLEGEAWKKSTMAEYTFIFLVKNANGDLLLKFLDKILPILLNLTDDITPRHAGNGIQCIRHVLEEVPSAELRYRGRIDVLYDALSRKIHSRNSSLLEELIPCLFLSLQCIETEMMRKRGTRIPKHDECFDTILTNFHLASEVEVKRTFAKFFPDFVSRMGIQVVGHMKMVSVVLEYGLETADLVMVDFLCKMIVEMVNVAWSRMANHAEKFIDLLVKTLYSIENDQWRTAYVSQADMTAATNSITEGIVKLAAVRNDLVLETIAMLKSEEDLGLGGYASKVQQLLNY